MLKIIEDDEKSYSTICNKYFDLFCEIITNNVAKPKKGKSDKSGIEKNTDISGERFVFHKQILKKRITVRDTPYRIDFYWFSAFASQ